MSLQKSVAKCSQILRICFIMKEKKTNRAPNIYRSNLTSAILRNDEKRQQLAAVRLNVSRKTWHFVSQTNSFVEYQN